MGDLNLQRTPGSVEPPTHTDKNEKDNSNKLPLKQRIRNFFANPKKRLLFIIFSGLFLIIIFGIGLYLMTTDRADKTASPKLTESEETPTIEKSLTPAVLNGVKVEDTIANRHPLAVIIENHVDARPQSGLSQADIVYEAVAEGGITRYLALFGTQEAEKVGPIRSARTYFVDWAHGYNAYLVHVGGNIDALEKIVADKILDLDQFKYSGPYWRDRSRGVATEHTMYSKTTDLRTQAEKNKYATENTFTQLKYKDDPSQTDLPENQTVSVNISNSASYNEKFVYEKSSNSYKRFLAGKADTDALTKKQINPKNIVIMSVTAQSILTRINELGYNVGTIGTGKAQIFFDGKKIEGTWRKTSADTRELFYDANGQEVTFNRGQFWIIGLFPSGSVTIE